MKPSFIRYPLCLIIIVILALCGTSEAGQFQVTRVYDGDTFKAVGHDIEIKVRMAGIDTPETSKRKNQPGQPFSDKAKKRLSELVLGKTVDIKGYGHGPYGRVIGVVYADGLNINLLLVREGLAEGYRGKPPRGFDITPYEEAEIQAKLRLVGIWTQMDRYISPMDWRKIKK